MKQSIYPVSLDKRLLQNTLNKSLDRYRMSIKKKWCHLSSVVYRKYRYNLVLNLWNSPAGMEHHFSDRYFLIYSLMVTPCLCHTCVNIMVTRCSLLIISVFHPIYLSLSHRFIVEDTLVIASFTNSQFIFNSICCQPSLNNEPSIKGS